MPRSGQAAGSELDWPNSAISGDCFEKAAAKKIAQFRLMHFADAFCRMHFANAFCHILPDACINLGAILYCSSSSFGVLGGAP